VVDWQIYLASCKEIDSVKQLCNKIAMLSNIY
jgi:hypothetical protein